MVLTIIIDILLLGMIGFGIFWGIKNGFISAIAKPVKFFASLLFAILLSSVAATAIIEPMIEVPLTGQISDYLVEKCDDITPDNAKDKVPTVLKFAAGVVNVDLEEIEGGTTEEYITALVETLAHPVVHLFATIIAFILLYFIFKLIFSLLLWLTNLMFKKGVVGVVNKIFGAVATTAFAMVVAWGFVSVFDYFINLSFIAENSWAMNFNGGFLYDFFKSVSPIDLLLSF